MMYDLQKASMWKRISAFLFDGILLVVLVVALALLISWVSGYDSYMGTFDAAYAKYEQEFGVKFDIAAEEYEALTEVERAKYDAAYQALIADKDAMQAYNVLMNLLLMTVSLSFLLAYVILEFVIPLILKNGQTLGKKIFGIAVMRTDGVRVTPIILFIRTFLGKYTIETMIPVLILLMVFFFGTMGIEGVLVLIAIAIVQVVLLIATKTNSLIHDSLAKTVTVDMASQMIFDSPEEVIEYQKRVAAEKAARQTY